MDQSWLNKLTNDLRQAEETAQTLREQLDQDTRILGSLDPDSDAYERLSIRIERRTTELLDCEEERERLALAVEENQKLVRQAMQRAAIKEHRDSQENTALIGGLVFMAIGTIVTVATWISWWVILGIVLFLLGLGSVVTHKTMWDS